MRYLLLLSLITLAGCMQTTKEYTTSDGGKLKISGTSPYTKSEAESMLRMENEGWKTAYVKYGSDCLKNLKAGQEVPRSMSVSSTKCFNKYISKYVRPLSLSPKNLDALMEDNVLFAQDYESKKINHKQYMEGLEGARSLYMLSRNSVYVLSK